MLPLRRTSSGGVRKAAPHSSLHKRSPSGSLRDKRGASQVRLIKQALLVTAAIIVAATLLFGLYLQPDSASSKSNYVHSVEVQSRAQQYAAALEQLAQSQRAGGATTTTPSDTEEQLPFIATDTTTEQQPQPAALKHKSSAKPPKHPLVLSSSGPINPAVSAEGQPTPNAVWLYTLLGADYPGTAALLPHWLTHYLGLGFQNKSMLVVVNHNSTSAAATQELAAVRQVLGSEGIQFTSWTERYSSDAHLKVKLQLLHERVRQPQDWIVIADSDEFINFGRSGLPIQHFLGAVERGGSNWVLGMLVDRVAPDGRLAPVAPAPALFHQFPLNCFVVKRLTGGFVWKTPAFKAYWRSNTGNHFIVQPDKAAQYFGAAPAGVKNSRGGYNGAEDLYALTPYKQHHTRYRYEDEEPQEGGVWEPLRYEEVLAVHHFKWHAGVLQSAADRLAYYKGDIKNTGQPRFQHYTESETILNLLAESQTLPIKEAQCKQDLRVWQDVQAGR